MESTVAVFDREDALKLLPPRFSGMNKTDRGRILVAGGSKNYPGAPILSALAALRSGSGIVSLLSFPEVCHVCASRLPEAVQLPTEEGAWLKTALEEPPRAHAAVTGPGLGRSHAAVSFVAALWKEWNKPLLVDGDGLYALAVSEGCLSRKDAVLTPHEGEAARLLAWTPEDVRRNRVDAAERLSKRWGCVLLKGEGSLVADRGKIFRLSQGGPELSVPGSGDVLSGCIGTFLAQGLSPLEAACLGGTLHGMAGARLREAIGIDGILASEIANTLPLILRSLRNELR
ncbi:MAG: NAD(P)H-hydrate dehydratase [Synergistaceae bacterium]|jgi:NAD(P)H-hydrate epimerase|nr:NAD(P)H-hydrate dehydratase [Synergistaceae bacterium]